MPLPQPTIRATFRMPLPAFRWVLMASSTFVLLPLSAYRASSPCWRTRFSTGGDSIAAGSIFPARQILSTPSRSSARPIEVEAVDTLLVAIEPDTGSIEFREGIGDVEHASAKPVDRPDHQDVEPSPHRVAEHGVECWPLIPAFGATDP